MTDHTIHPEIPGTRSGYVIRYTCPRCNTENSIVNKSPRDHYKLNRDTTCTCCRKRCRVVTPAIRQSPEYPPVRVIVPTVKNTA